MTAGRATSYFQELVSGQRRGIGAALSRASLRVLEVPYHAAVQLRNRRFDRRHDLIRRVEVPVVSLGNLTVGGTGKTPMVQWVARWFRQHGIRVALVSRGYGAEAGSRNDEALQLEQTLPDVPHVQDPDRVAGAQLAIEEFHSQLILLDDGFQHRRLHRDLDIVMLDATAPFGFGHLLPRGLLREPIRSLQRSHLVVLSRADMISLDERQKIRDCVERIAPQAGWVETVHQPRRLLSAAAAHAPLETLRGRRVAAFCGIGNPAAFQHSLSALGYQLAGFRAFGDHYPYEKSAVEEIAAWAQQLAGIEALICTHKDLVKLGIERLGGVPLWALMVEMEVIAGLDVLEDRLSEVGTRITAHG